VSRSTILVVSNGSGLAREQPISLLSVSLSLLPLAVDFFSLCLCDLVTPFEGVACIQCLYSVPVFSACIHCLYSVPVFSACIHCLYSLPVFTACIHCLYSLPVFTACIHCLYSLSVFTACIHCLYSLPVFTACIHCLYGWKEGRGGM
jgi:hypothetical protein